MDEEEFGKNLTENEIIDILEDFSTNEGTSYCYDWDGFNWTIILPAIQGLLDLYKKEKEKNNEFEFKNRTRILGKYGEPTLGELIKDKFVSKDKIKEKIKEVEFHIEHVDYNEGQAMYKILQELLEDKDE